MGLLVIVYGFGFRSIGLFICQNTIKFYLTIKIGFVSGPKPITQILGLMSDSILILCIFNH